MSKLQFKILKQKWNARVWEITLNGITLKTPIFMPVGTKATIKWLILDILQDPKYIWEHIDPIKLILAIWKSKKLTYTYRFMRFSSFFSMTCKSKI